MKNKYVMSIFSKWQSLSLKRRILIAGVGFTGVVAVVVGTAVGVTVNKNNENNKSVNISPIEKFNEHYPNAINGRNEVIFNAFSRRNLPDDFRLPEGIVKINQFAFLEVKIPVGFTIPSTVKEVSNFAFQYAELPIGFEVPKTLTAYESSVFEEAILPDGSHWTKDGAEMGNEPFEGGHEYKVVKD